MNQGHLWKFLLIVFIVSWSSFTVYPPTSKNLVDVFEEKAVNKDTNFTAIVAKARELTATNSVNIFGNLKTAIGDQLITNYFPTIDVSKELSPANYTRVIMAQLQRDAAGKIKLGLDLRGGTSFTVGLDTSAITTAATNQIQKGQEERAIALSQAIEVLRKRVDRFGIAEPIIQPEGEDRIVIQIPGLTEDEKEDAKNQIKKAAFLEFRLVHKDNKELLEKEIIPPGYMLLKEISTHQGKETAIPYLVTKKAEMTGEYVSRAHFDRDHMTGQPQIAFELTPEGARKFGEITTQNEGRLLAIVLDGQLRSAPRINEPITGGRGVINGSFTEKEAVELANVLENPLKTPVKILDSREVDPTLGADSIKGGVKAALYGTALVVAFMLVYYLLAGVVANVALMLNIIILFGVMCYFGTTLTLPGIAGIVLTIGMAVDANVLIYERMREELAAGKSIRGAINGGYDKAFSTILDSNLTTLIASVILIYLGTGPVKGFGVTLTIGITVSMFTALVVTRLVFDAMLHLNLIKSLNMLHIVKGSKIEFMKYAKVAFCCTWAVIIIGLAYAGYREFGGDKNKTIFGVDFAGGDSITMTFAQRIPAEKIRGEIEKLNVGEAQISYEKNSLTSAETIRIVTAFEKGDIVQKAVIKAFPDAKFQPKGSDKVGPTVGAEITKSAFIAAALAMLGILVYVAFRYEFSFAIGAIISLIHDILMTLAIFFLAGRQLNAPIVAVCLTIIGFSINDTIVIFDRIREDLKMGVRGSFTEIMNQALNQTLSRTIITSGTVFLATGALYIWGGGSINDFAFAFLIGIVTGTYSSIYIASAFVLWYNKGERPQLASNVAIDATVAKEQKA